MKKKDLEVTDRPCGLFLLKVFTNRKIYLVHKIKSCYNIHKQGGYELDTHRFLKDALKTYVGVYVGTLIFYLLFKRDALNLIHMIWNVIPTTLIVIAISELYIYWKRKRKTA